VIVALFPPTSSTLDLTHGTRADVLAMLDKK
jgi:hypothetical protein